MTRTDLLALANAATRGPWEWERRGFQNTTLSLMSPQFIDGQEAHPLNLLNTDAKEWNWNGEHNRAFICAARTAVPELIAENERLRAAARAVVEGTWPSRENYGTHQVVHDRVERKLLDALRAALTENS